MSATAEHAEVTGQYVRVTVTGAANAVEAEEAAFAYLNTDNDYASAEWTDDRTAGEFEVVFRKADVPYDFP